MTPSSAVLAIIPPAFALLVEYYNPVSDEAISSSVERDLESYRGVTGLDHDTLKAQVKGIVGGAVEVAGLAPTFVACLTSGFGVLNEYPNLWVAVVYVLIFLALILFLLNFLSGRSYFAMVDSVRRINLLIDRNDACRAVKVVSVLIYIANFLLIAFVIVVYAVTKDAESHDERKPTCLPEVPCLYVHRINVQVRDVDVPHLFDGHVTTRISSAGMPGLVTTSGRRGEDLVAAADTVE